MNPIATAGGRGADLTPPPEPNRVVTIAAMDDARAWFDAAMELDAENRLLRQALTDVMFWISDRRELLAFAHAEIARRWPEPESQR